MDLEEKVKKIDDLFSRGVGEFIDPDGAFREKLVKKARGEYDRDIIIKFGVDPTRPDIHLGHAVVLRKLRAFQDLGCKVIFLIGDFTARIGDPTGKSKVRPEIDQREVERNMMTYLEQVGKITLVGEDRFSWIRNSDWFLGVADIQPKPGNLVRFKTTFINPSSFIGKAVLYDETRMQKTHLKKAHVVSVSLANILSTLRHITHSRLIERDMFRERIEKNEELFMHEMMYPVLQGIDSHVLNLIYGSCDLEVGGTDQTFNMLLGRDIMKMNGQEPQAVLSFKLLEGTDGKEKMSKSLGNYVAISDEPFDMFGKIMSIPDSSIGNYFELCTYMPLSDIEKMQRKIDSGEMNPRDAKELLAEQIVTMYHGKDAAGKAKEGFSSTFKKGGIPDNIPETSAEKGASLAEVLVNASIVSSKTEFRRLLDEGAIEDLEKGEEIKDAHQKIEEPLILKVGKRRFIKINIK
ncbi:MAG TPA: tyrosine--tRNA ligase [Candidatus Paceibacterota bacterium]|nr:tyrosine--tRNA ligase [Candidatus Paceibacterota bacterium]